MTTDSSWNDTFVYDDDYDSQAEASDSSNSDMDYNPGQDSDTESESEDNLEAGPAIQLQNTRNLRAQIQGSTAEKVRRVLHVMDAVGINLPIFLDALSWGDVECTADSKIRYARSSLMTSEELPSILRRWWKPPRSSASRKSRPKGARATMTDFVFECLCDTVEKELDSIADYFRSPFGNDVTEEELTSLGLEEMTAQIKKDAPRLWGLLFRMAWTTDQGVKNTRKTPDKIVLTTIMMLSYTRSHHRNRFQKMLSIYLKFRGLSAKGFDTLHALALTMSHRWTANTVGRMSKAAMDEVVPLLNRFAWLLSYDNVQIPFRVFSQRLDNQGEFGNGTAATVYIKRSAKPLPPSANRDLQEHRAEGMKTPLTMLDIMDLASESFPRIQEWESYHVLQFLLDAPEFEFKTYKGNNSEFLKAPKAQSQLPSGPEHITLQYLLGTVNIPEASYDDHGRLVNEWFAQLKMNSMEERMKLALEKLIAFAGDQLTIDRLRGLFKFRAEDLNSFDRLDWVLLPFGWFHLQMAVANSLHKQYLGTSKGRGLSQAFDLLERKGLGSVSTKGVFHHNLNEALYHVAEAHLRVDWLIVSGAKSLVDLRSKDPKELKDLAAKIIQDHASNEALDRIDAKPKEQQDKVKRQTIMWTRDVLQYIVLNHAIKTGNVGIMEDMLPHLLFRFVGGGNSNYAGEVLELLQGLQKEWTPVVRDFVRDNCWLINSTGNPDGFLPVDKAQEHNIKGIKVTYRSEGPNIQWEYLKKLHPAIRVIRALTVHMENEFATLTRGKRHTVPQKELDVQKLFDSYRAAKIHDYQPGRKVTKGDRATDYTMKGCLELQKGKILQRWIDGRSFSRATTQDWQSEGSDISSTSEDI